MTRRLLRVRPEAEVEIEFAAEWYESKRPGLGAEFMASLDAAFEAVLETPTASPRWRSNYPFRKYLLRRFPHVVFFKIEEDAVEIVAVAHAKRRPGYWLRR